MDIPLEQQRREFAARRFLTGYVHAGLRTAGVVAAWYAWPSHRFVAVPLVIVAVYLVTIAVLEQRWRSMRRPAGRVTQTSAR